MLFAFLYIAVLLVCDSVQNGDFCGSVYTRKQFVIQSPNYPGAYPPQTRCSYFLKGENCATYYVFQLLEFDLEESTGCTKDRLEIEDQDALCGTKSGVKTYFSAGGLLNLTFISDVANLRQASRFKILITRLPCSSGASQESTVGQFNHRTVPNCCSGSYGLKNFYIASPGFPYSTPQSTDCVYNIRKASENTCRLRINVLYFNNGEYDANYDNCIGGYLELDGKKLCGCHTGLKLVTAFDGDRLVKSIRFKSEDVLSNELRGFVLEIIQDECPKKYESYNSVVKHVNYFVPSDEHRPGEIDPRGFRRDREETTYLDISGLDSDSYGNNDKAGCKNWGVSTFPLVAREALWRNMVPCGTQRSSSSPSVQKCVELNASKGYFRSPGYPMYYPSNLNLCYRFTKRPGVCAVRISFFDFLLQYSQNCEKDYLLVANTYRYCGHSLYQSTNVVNLENKDAEEMKFVTDERYCGRGFNAIYEHIPCQNGEPPQNACSKLFRENSFILEIFDYNEPMCRITIKKNDSSVCKLQLIIEVANLICGTETLQINSRTYCGYTGPTTMIVDFKEDVQVIYQRSYSNRDPAITGLRLRLSGTQVREGCDPYQIPEVDPERLISTGEPHTTKTLLASEKTDYLLTVRENEKEVCGFVINNNTPFKNETFCERVLRNDRITSCIPVSEDLPYTNDSEIVKPDLDVFHGLNTTFLKTNCNISLEL